MDNTTQLLSTPDTISVIELKRLLQEVKDRRPDIGVRFRFLGQMWQDHFLTVFLVTENGAVLIDQTNNKTEIISNLADVVQFELDGRFHNFHPYYHYIVQP
jgi:hypothetical protein